MKFTPLLSAAIVAAMSSGVCAMSKPPEPTPPTPPPPAEEVNSSRVHVIPQPDTITFKADSQRFQLRADTRISAAQELGREAQLLAGYLNRATGFAISDSQSGQPIELRLNTALKKEGYTLDVSADKIIIEGGDKAGVFYGIQSLRQLLPAEIYSPHEQKRVSWNVRAVTIKDNPKYAWRGLLLDSARWFQPKAYIKDMLDQLAAYKINKFHWHLTDDNGWRIEIKQYPKLTEVGAQRSESLIWNDERDIYWTLENVFKIDFKEFSDGKPHQGYYTQDDIREIVQYAADRNIEIIPEIDLPGHAQAAVAAYPEILSSRTDGVVPQPRKLIAGISNYVVSPKPESIQFFKNVLDEVMDLFPGKHIHLGGDEVKLDQWKDNPSIQEYRKSLNIADDHQLAGHFLKQLYQHVIDEGRQPLGWNEVLDFHVPANDVDIMFWRAIDQKDYSRRALDAGHRVIYTPNTILYMHGCQEASQQNKERDCLLKPNDIETVYNYDPVAADNVTDPAKKARIRGIQAALWENGHARHGNHNVLQEILYPRMLAVAEAGWTDNKNYTRFSASIEQHKQKLDFAGIDYFNHDFGDSIELLARSNGYCLDVKGSRTHNGNSIISFLCNGTNAERWYYDRENHWLRNRMDKDKCLGFDGNIQRGTNVVVTDCNASTRLNINLAQERIHSATDNKHSVDQTTRVIAAEIHMWDNHGGSNQKWRTFYQAPRLMKLKNRESGLCLSRDGEQLRMLDCNDGLSQKWYYRAFSGSLISADKNGQCLTRSADNSAQVSRCNFEANAQLLIKDGQFISENGRNSALTGATLTFTEKSNNLNQYWDLIKDVKPASNHNTGDQYLK